MVATDPDTEDQGLLIYSLSGTDAASFDIERTSGQITAKVPLDYETKKSYRVTVKALDPSGASGTVTVTISVTDVDEPPELSKKGLVALGRGFIGYEENETRGSGKLHGGGAECGQRQLEAQRDGRLGLLHQQQRGADLQVDAEFRGAGGLEQ